MFIRSRWISATQAGSNLNVGATNTVLGQSIGQPTQGSPFQVNMYSTAGPTVTQAPQSIAPIGGSQPHENEQPYLVLNFVIALVGVFPSQN